MGGIRPEFGALIGPKKGIRAGENLFAKDSALLFIILKNGVYGALEWFAKILHARERPRTSRSGD
jgi:hypothetical protein